jgi:hypothetical protein
MTHAHDPSHHHGHAPTAQGHPVDIHAHWYPDAWLKRLAQLGPAHGLEYKDVPGKGPQFKHGYLATGPCGPRFIDLDARLHSMDEQGVAVHALSLSQPMLYWPAAKTATPLPSNTTTNWRAPTSCIPAA